MPNEIVRLQNVSIGYNKSKRKKTIVQRNLNLHALQQEIIMLIGANGAGKSTLLRSLMGFLPVLSGNLTLFGKSISSYSPVQMSKQISYVSTEIVQQSYMTVFELAAYGRTPYTNHLGTLTDNDKKIVSGALENVSMLKYARKYINQISDGERQRVMLARALAQDTPLIILDEPTAFLDLSHRYEIIGLLRKLSVEQQKTIILSTHDLNIALREADKIWLILSNKVHSGAPEDLALNNCYDSLFENDKSNSMVYFDEKNGDFVSHKSFNRKFNLLVSQTDSPITEKLVRWTTRALYRNGFLADKNVGETIIIDAETKKWTFKKNTYNSIEELIRGIKQNNLLNKQK